MYTHKLQAIRIAYGLTVAELAELSDISVVTIHRIESGNHPKVNEATAKALADALYEQTLSIFRVEELSHRGRPPHTGTPIVCLDKPSTQRVCPHCFIGLPATGICDDHGDVLNT